MRLDKFLKVSRLIKRRTVANEACDAGRVSVNGKPAKASVQVKPGRCDRDPFRNKRSESGSAEAGRYDEEGKTQRNCSGICREREKKSINENNLSYI